MRGIVRKILAASRFELDIHEAADSTAALDQLRNGSFGMVFLDYNMPRLNGANILLGIKHESPDVAIVMMSSALNRARRGPPPFVGRARVSQKAVLSGRRRRRARALFRPARLELTRRDVSNGNFDSD
jgi:CheY-like chemotaxis protein